MAQARRRLAAILAADAAGYSRLMAANEEATIAALRDSRALFRAAIEARGGRVVDTAGDSILAVFDSVVEAVRAANEVQDQLRDRAANQTDAQPMSFRIGVNLGDIVEEDDGSVYGDGVNIAARLEGLAEPGGIVVGDLARQTIGDREEIAFVDVGEHQVKNIAQPVRAFAVVRDGTGRVSTSGKQQAGSRRFVAVFVAAALVFAGIVAWQSKVLLERKAAKEAAEQTETIPVAEAPLTLPEGPSIAVLPFENLSNDAEQNYFADGVTEEIITALTRFSNLFVLGRDTTFQYQGETVDIDRLRDELGVRYVLLGSVRRAGDRVRVSARLVQAEDGAQLWGDNYERDLSVDGIFAIQDQITERIVGTIAGAHGVMARAGADAAQNIPTANLDAYDCVLRVHEMRRSITPEARDDARTCLERAVEVAPNYSDAWASLALVYVLEYSIAFDGSPESVDRGLEAARRAAELDPTSAWAHLALARGLFFRRDVDQAIDEALEAVRLNPMNADIVGTAGYYIAFSGQRETGRALIDRAIALNPVYPTWYRIPDFYQHYANRDYARALEVAKETAAGRASWRSHMRLAIAHAQAGELAEGEAAVADLLASQPDFPRVFRDWAEKWNFAPEDVQHMIEGLRKAGLDIADLAMIR